MSGPVQDIVDTPMDTKLAALHTMLPNSRLVGDGHTSIQRIQSDTRQMRSGDCFIALRGERFDGNRFVETARQAGAVAAIVHPGALPAGMSGLEVPDTLQALGALGKAWRAQFALRPIAVTGSNGKTTVTQMIASILRAWDAEHTMATAGNFNNAIGVPLTLLRLRAHHRAAVLELGMNHPGEIALLADMAQPGIALINNAQREHQEFMHSVDAVAAENGSVIDALPADGWAVFPQSDTYAGLWRARAGARHVLQFGEGEGADVRLLDTAWDGNTWQLRVKLPIGNLETRLSILGRHNVHNALAAVACACAAGVPIAAMAMGLASFRPVSGRMRTVQLPVGAGAFTLIDDTYNANPDSVRRAIDALAELQGPHLLVLGDMGEVGEQGPAFHAEVGAWARERGLEFLLGTGALSIHAVQAFGTGGRHVQERDDMAGAVLAAIRTGVQSVLIKGSRSMAMERVVAVLERDLQSTEEPSC